MATNLPIGFNFNGRGRTAPPRIGYRADKGRTQAQFVPKLQRPLSNGGVDANNGLELRNGIPVRQRPRKTAPRRQSPTATTGETLIRYCPRRADRDRSGTRVPVR